MTMVWRLLLVTVSVLIGVALGEAYCRTKGLPFPGFVTRAMANTPAIFELDDALGWRLKPGQHHVFGGKQVTVLADSSRDTGSPAGTAPDVLVVGCSYTMGWGVSDGDDYVSRLRASHPDLAFRNYGTAGYGAYQSLLTLERRLPELLRPPRLVLYGMIAHHESRSHGDPAWSMMVSSMPIPEGRAEAPYASVGAEGGLERHGRLEVPSWPLDGQLNVVSLAKLDWLRFQARGRLGQGRPVTERAIVEMKRIAAKAGARFAVVLLDLYGPAKDAYLARFKADAIDYVDCADPAFLKPEMRLADHIHPNEAMHARYASCISGWMEAAGIAAPGGAGVRLARPAAAFDRDPASTQ
jgi:hypothetical protein